MSSLRELIYSQSGASQSSLFYTPQVVSTVVEEDPRPAEKIIGAISAADPSVNRSSLLGKRVACRFPVYWRSPTVEAERKRARQELPHGSRLAPGTPGGYMFPQLEERYTGVYRAVVRHLWDLCTRRSDADAAIQVLRVLCKIDALDETDLAKAILVLRDSTRAESTKLLVERLYKLTKQPHKNTDKDQLLALLVDYYALVEGDVSIAQDLAEGQPALAAVSVTLLCMRCIEMARRVRGVGTGASAGQQELSIQAVVENLSTFADTVLLLKECLASPEYGLLRSGAGNDDAGSSESEQEGHYNPRRRAAPRAGSLDPALPAKREISSALTALGTALRSLLGRRVGRPARADSESDGSSVASEASDSSDSAAAGDADGRQDPPDGCSVDLRVLFACYLCGTGDPRQGMDEIKKMIQLNHHLPRAHMLHVRFLCSQRGSKKADVAAAVEQWARADPSSAEAVFLSLLLLKAELSVEMGRLAIPQGLVRVPLSFTIAARRRRVVDILCGAIELLPPSGVSFHRADESIRQRFLHHSDFKFPFGSSQFCLKCRRSLHGNSHYVEPSAATSLVTAWTFWSSLASLLGPLPPPKKLAKIYVPKQSNYYELLIKKLRVTYAVKAILREHGISLPTPSSRPEPLIRPQPLQSHFQELRHWWKNSILAPHFIPLCGRVDDETLRSVVEAVDGFDPVVCALQEQDWQALDWLDPTSPLPVDASVASEAGAREWDTVVSIGSSMRSKQCTCNAAAGADADAGIDDGINKTRFDVDGDISTNVILKEILCSQIVISSHLHGGCTDNMFAVLGVSLLLFLCSDIPSMDERKDSLAHALRYLSAMNVDVVRAVRLSNLLVAISKNPHDAYFMA